MVNKADSTTVEELINMNKSKVNEEFFESNITRIMESMVDRQDLYNIKEILSQKIDNTK